MLANDFFRVAHHDVTGRARLSGRVLSLGLAAALIGELLSARHVDVVPFGGVGDVVTLVPAGWPDDAVLRAVWAEVAAERAPQPVRVWLAYLAETAYERVGERLVEARGVRPRRRWGRTSYVLVDMNAAAAPTALLSQKLRRGLVLDYGDVCLGGMVLATGLDLFLLDGAQPEAYARLHSCVRRLWTPMRRVVEHTQAAVGDAVLSHRT